MQSSFSCVEFHICCSRQFSKRARSLQSIFVFVHKETPNKVATSDLAEKNVGSLLFVNLTYPMKNWIALLILIGFIVSQPSSISHAILSNASGSKEPSGLLVCAVRSNNSRKQWVRQNCDSINSGACRI